MSTPGMRAGDYRPDPLSKIMANVRVVDEVRVMPKAIAAQEVIDPDVSWYQDKNTTTRKIDFVKMKAAGCPGVIIRAGQGNWIDEDFIDFWRDAKAAGLARAAYWYYDPRHEPAGQADKFTALFVNDPPELNLLMDAEYPASWGGSFAGWQHLRTFQERVKFKAPTLSQEVYTGYYWWYDNVWMKTSVTERAYFKQYPLHLAWYTTDASVVKIPLPWTQAEFRWWQFTSTGDGPQYGAESPFIDLNYFVPGGLDLFKETYGLTGATPALPPIVDGYQKVRRYNSDVHIWRGAASLKVTNNGGDLIRPSSFAGDAGDVVINGDGWVPQAPYLPYSLAVSNSTSVQAIQRDFRPFINSKADESVVISGTDKANAYNLVSGTRYSVKAGVNAFVNSTDPEHITERHPRTAIGYTQDGRLIACVVDGRSTISAGVTLYELANVMIEAGAEWALELDGGDSSIMLVDGFKKSNNGDLLNGVRTERATVNSVIFTTGESPMPTPTVNYYDYLATGNRAIRVSWGATSSRISAYSDFYLNTHALGGALPEDRHTLTAAEAMAMQGLVGDVWVKLFDNNGRSVVGWTALIHRGLAQCTERLVIVETPVPAGDISIDMTLKADGTIVGTWTDI